LHEKNIVINSLDPKRIFLTAEGRVRIEAFDFLNIWQSLRHASKTGDTTHVNYIYVAPEMTKEWGVIPGDFSTEVYLFGLLAFELACGVPPFDANRELLISFTKQNRVPNIMLQTGLPGWYDSLVKRCLAKDPKKRITFAEIDAELKAHLTSNENSLTIVPSYFIRQSSMCYLSKTINLINFHWPERQSANAIHFLQDRLFVWESP